MLVTIGEAEAAFDPLVASRARPLRGIETRQSAMAESESLQPIARQRPTPCAVLDTSGSTK